MSWCRRLRAGGSHPRAIQSGHDSPSAFAFHRSARPTSTRRNAIVAKVFRLVWNRFRVRIPETRASRSNGLVYARRKAEAWWRQRSPDPIPASAERAVELAEAGALAATLAITVRSVSGEPYNRIVEYELGELPEAVGIDVCDSFGGLEEIPF